MTAPGPPDHDVVIIGAGLSGIGAAWRLQEARPRDRYVIFEARDAIGGTWDLFRYPGIRSDSDMFTLGYPFRPWPHEHGIGNGDEIRDYLAATAAEGGIDTRIRFGHRVVRAEWSSADARWTLTVERRDPDDPATVATFETTAGFVFSCTGYYRYDRGHEPDIEGLADFAGDVVHPQFWPEDLDVSGRRIAVIGSGATAVTLIPCLAEAGAHVTMVQRSPTYIAVAPTRNPLHRAIRRVLPRRAALATLRWVNALAGQAAYFFSRRRPDLMRRMLLRDVARHLPEGFDVATHFTPRYDPWDQRLCLDPDGALFGAIRDGRAGVVTGTIERVTPEGITMTSGETVPADLIVTATGLELLFLGGMEVLVDGEKVEAHERLSYKGMMLEGVPNFAMAVGYTNASWTLKSDLSAQYVGRLLNHMEAHGTPVCTPVAPEGSVSAEPMLGLTSGYIQRSAHLFPLQGEADPWRVHQSYLHDHRLIRRGDIDDGAMRFSAPATAPA